MAALSGKLEKNTRLTVQNNSEITALHGTVTEIKTDTDSLLEMKKAFDTHLGVLCTWRKWGRRARFALLSVAGAALPVIVAANALRAPDAI